MTETKDKVCSLCNGKQWLYEYKDEEVIAIRCKCLDRKLLREYLGSEIYDAKWVKSELYRPTEEGDRTSSNLFLKGTWKVVCQHLHWVLTLKRRHTPSFTYRIVQDNTVLRVWLGAYAYTHRSKEVRNEIETYNSLDDLVAGPDLLILRLGVVTRRNKALPDVVHEALKIREYGSKPTWIIEGLKAFNPNHLAYSDELNNYIGEDFEIVDLGGDVEAEREELKAVAEEALDFDVAMGVNTEKPEIDDADTYDIPEKKPSKFDYKKRKDGGLPELE